MSAKRRAHKELSRDNWDHQSEEEEDNNESILANKADLQNRKILTAKRRSGSNAYNTPNHTPNKIQFSNNANTNINNRDNQIVLESPIKKSDKLNIINFTNPKMNGDSDFNSNKDVENTDKEIIEHYYQCLEKLNMTVFEWLAKCIKSTPRGDMSPIFTNYFKHIQELKNKYSIECVPQDNDPCKTENFDQQPFWTTTSINSKPDSQNISRNDSMGAGFFTNPSTTSQKTEPFKTSLTTNSLNKGFTFQNNVEIAKTTEIFNKDSNKQSSQSIPFVSTNPYTVSFNNGTSKNSSFVFSNASNFTFKPTVTDAHGEGDSSPPDPESNEPSEYEAGGLDLPSAPADPNKPSWEEEGAFYVKRCKLFRKGDGPQFLEAGLGYVYVKANTTSPHRSNQLLVRADNASGTVLLNAAIPPNTPITLSGKNGVLVVASVSNGSDERPKPSTFLIRVKTTEDAKELREALLTNQLE